MLNLRQILIPIISGLVTASVLLLGRGFSLRILRQRSEKGAKKGLEDTIIKSIKIPSLFWILAFALYIGIALSNLPAKYTLYLSKAIEVTIIFSVTLALANLLANLLQNYFRQIELPIATAGISFALLKGTVLVIGFLIILNVLGISIVPLITALGLGGLAIALALQDTLANLFAGINLLLEKSIRVGDFVRLETGQEGYVEDITWRTTRLRMLPNNMVIIPNSKLAQSVFTNYHLPEKKLSVLIPVNVSYSSDPEKVEKILLEETKKAAEEIPGLLAQPEPLVRFIPGFGDYSLNFTLICSAAEFRDQYLVQHELRKRILRRFKEEGIEIPFPQRRVIFKRAEE